MDFSVDIWILRLSEEFVKSVNRWRTSFPFLFRSKFILFKKWVDETRRSIFCIKFFFPKRKMLQKFILGFSVHVSKKIFQGIYKSRNQGKTRFFQLKIQCSKKNRCDSCQMEKKFEYYSALGNYFNENIKLMLELTIWKVVRYFFHQIYFWYRGPIAATM